METITGSVLDLKPILDRYQRIELSAYQRLGKFIEIKRVKAKGIVRFPNLVENESRIILNGLIGAYKDGILIRLFFPEEICMDSSSYFESTKSKIELKVLEDTEYTSLTRAAAEQILNTIPEFQQISPLMISMAKSSNENWMALTQMPWRELLYHFKSRHPGIESIVSQKDLAGLIHIDPKTIQRRNRREFEKAKRNRVYKLIENSLTYPFKAHIHNRSDEIEEEAVDWARFIQGFLNESIYQQKFKKMNLGGLSTYLYPEAGYDNSVWISKFYLLLFAMDDLSDQITNSLKEVFWKKIEKGFLEILVDDLELGFPGQNIMSFLTAFKGLFDEFRNLYQVDEAYISLFKTEIRAYLDANVWEAKNRTNERIPSISEYLYKRPIFSGGNLSMFLGALSINRKFGEIQEDWDKLDNYRSLGSRLIFISNDLISFFKEKRNGDFHNWMTLLIHHEGLTQDEAREVLLEEHRKTLKQFLEFYESFQSNYQIQDGIVFTLMREFKYKVSGAVEWSLYQSSRYQWEGRVIK